MTDRLYSKDLSVGFGKTTALDSVSLVLPDNIITAIVGANACGKSTLLRSLSRLQDPSQGGVFLDGKALQSHPTKALAREIALLPQSTISPAGMRIIDLVCQGRTPHQSPLRQWSVGDHEQVQNCLEQVGLHGLEHRLLSELSGGQRQRAWIAMALAQDTKILFLDEPTTYLDMSHQIEILTLIRRLQQQRGLTVAMVLHDVNLASRFCDQVIAMKEHKVFSQGSPKEIMTVDNIRAVFDLDATIIADPHTGLPHVIAK